MKLFDRYLDSSSLLPGSKAPEFTLTGADGNSHSLTDYRGKWLILYFYPKDDTPGCTIEASNFRDDLVLFNQANAIIVGINTDKTYSHQKFVAKYKLPFTLISDINGDISRVYGALFKLGPLKISKRQTFIIDPQGIVRKIYRSVSPSIHSKQVLEALQVLQKVS